MDIVESKEKSQFKFYNHPLYARTFKNTVSEHVKK